ncbi:MAG: glycosyltransferase [Nanoarchaeota archaeon]|nr:glycosyltransferase [Nanoarchaeota archaeon]
MRTAIVTNKIGSVGGVQTFSNDLANLLEERGHHVDLIGRESLGNYEGNNLEEAVGNFFNKANKLFPYDVVLCNGEFGYSVEHPKAINVFHGNYYGYAMSVRDLVPESVTRGRLEKAKLQKVSAKEKYVVSVSESSRNQLEAYGIPVDKVINNSVDTNLFFPIESPVEDHSISLARGMYYEKGFDILHRLGKMGIKIRVYSDLKIESLNLD